MIRKAEYDDLDQIEKIFQDIIIFEEQNIKYTAFQANIYPTKLTAEKALNEGSLYVYEADNEICACMILNNYQPDEYKKINWKYEVSSDKITVIHLLCVSPQRSGHGIGAKLVEYAVDEGKQNSFVAVRLDTGAQNKPAKHLYEKLGFTVAETGAMSIGGLIPHKGHLFYEMKL